ncbi:hypothetical protein AAIH58_37695, partial [Pseudomonas aeruginosa]
LLYTDPLACERNISPPELRPTSPLVRKLSEKHIGMVDLPLLSVPSLQQQMVGHRSANMTLEQLEALNAEQKARTVLVVQDPFTSYYDAQVVADFVRL